MRSASTHHCTSKERPDRLRHLVVCRVRHQIQVYAFQAHLEGQLAAALLPQALRSPNAGLAAPAMSHGAPRASAPVSKSLERSIAQLRLAQAFLGKGAEAGLCSVTTLEAGKG